MKKKLKPLHKKKKEIAPFPVSKSLMLLTEKTKKLLLKRSFRKAVRRSPSLMQSKKKERRLWTANWQRQ